MICWIININHRGYEMKKLLTVMGVAALVACASSASAQTVDVEAMKAKTMPAANTVAESDLCAAEMTLMTYLMSQVEDTKPEDLDSFKEVMGYWVNRAAAQHQMSYDTYTGDTFVKTVADIAAVEFDTHLWYVEQCLGRMG